MNQIEETGTRTRKKYRENHIYIVLGNEFCTISMIDSDYEQRTMAGLDLVAALITMMLKYKIPLLKILSCCIKSSRGNGDIPGILIDVIKSQKQDKN